MSSKVGNSIGKEVTRVDGPLKVTGRAKYAADHNLKGLLYAVPVGSTVANGKIVSMNVQGAESMPGVVKVYHHHNVSGLYSGGDHAHEQRIPLSDETIEYYGQYIALVVAKTLEQAQAAASEIKVEYSAQPPTVTAQGLGNDLGQASARGDAGGTFASSPVQVDANYSTPTEVHNPMELHATVVDYKEEGFTVYESTQSVMGSQRGLMNQLGEPQERMRVVAQFIGSGFGGKLALWPHATLAAVASKDLKLPVKLMITRKMAAETVGHRPGTHQRVRLGAEQDGKINSLIHEYGSESSMGSGYRENCGEATPSLYGAQNLRVTSGIYHLNVGSPTAMRGPGAVPGTYATECAMDELAQKLGMDPIELRKMNEPKLDLSNGRPFSSRHYLECLEEGAKRFGWHKRKSTPGQPDANGNIHGYGVAGCSWFAGRGWGDVLLELLDDGTASVACATQDIGTGTYTVVAQMAADRLGIDPHLVNVKIGDSRFPPGPTSGGSTATAGLVPAVLSAAENAVVNLLQAASTDSSSPFSGISPHDLALTNGFVHQASQSANSGVPWGDLLKKLKRKSMSGKGNSQYASPDQTPVSMHSYGCHFAEVVWQPQLAQIRVSRVCSVIDAGKIINPLTGKNQIEGAVIMGVGMALMEQSIYDRQSGAPINSNFAEYLVPTHMDAPDVDVHFLDYPDFHINQLGARGIGEIGLAGVAAAIANAVANATGKRVRDLPITVEKLLS